MIRRHLRRAGVQEAALDRATRDAFASYGRYWMELFRLGCQTPAEIIEGFDVVGYERIDAALERGKGAILALPHLGGFDFAGAFLAARGAAPIVVVEALEPAALFDWFVSVRDRVGMTVIGLDENAGTRVAQALRDNRVVCLLADRDIAGDGVEVDFFGERTTMPAGPAVLALRTGAALMTASCYFTPHGGHNATISTPIVVQREGTLRADVARITQQLADEFEELIRASPEQWHLMQPNWPSDFLAAESRRS